LPFVRAPTLFLSKIRPFSKRLFRSVKGRD